jgi:hypothetical protein
MAHSGSQSTIAPGRMPVTKSATEKRQAVDSVSVTPRRNTRGRLRERVSCFRPWLSFSCLVLHIMSELEHLDALVQPVRSCGWLVSGESPIVALCARHWHRPVGSWTACHQLPERVGTDPFPYPLCSRGHLGRLIRCPHCPVPAVRLGTTSRRAQRLGSDGLTRDTRA